MNDVTLMSSKITSNVTWIYHFPYKVSHWTEEGKISFLHVGLVSKSTHRDKAINQNKGKSQSITLKFAIA